MKTQVMYLNHSYTRSYTNCMCLLVRIRLNKTMYAYSEIVARNNCRNGKATMGTLLFLTYT